MQNKDEETNTAVLTTEKRQELARYIYWHLGGDHGYNITKDDVFNELTTDVLFELLEPIGNEIFTELRKMK